MKKILVVLLLVIVTVFSITGCELIQGFIGENNYTVTFDSDGGSAVDSQTVKSGEAATAPAAPTKTGYTFAGWFVGESKYDFATPITADITVKAAWTINNYTVSFDTDGGNAIDAQSVAYGSTATAPAAPTKTGYTFAGWFVGEAEYDFATPVAADVTVKAAWTINNYTVSFDTDGGNAIDAQSVAYGSAATAPAAPTKTGYTFAGWFVGEAEYDFATPITADITIKATWTANGYEVTFDTDGADAIAPVVVTYGETVAQPADPTKTGYTFAGWFVGETEYDFATPISADITIKAAWTINTYNVTFDANGGSAVDAQTIAYGSAATAPAAPTKPGFKFTGWTLDGAEYDFATPITTEITLVATWALDLPDLSAIAGTYTGEEEISGYGVGNTYTFVINADGKIDASYENSYTSVNMTVNYVLFADNVLTINYTASGTTADIVFTYSDGKLTTDSSVSGSPLTIAKTYKVIFDSNGANKDKEYTVAHGDTVTEYKPSRTGYDLEGWYLDGAKFDLSTPITSDITLVANWAVKMITVTFYAQDYTTVQATIKVPYNTVFGDIETPTDVTTADGYKFNGKWYGTATSTSPVSATSKLTADKSYYPGFIAPMTDIEGTWKGTDSKGAAYTIVIDAANQDIAATLVKGDVTDELDITTIYYKDFNGTTKLVIRYIADGATSETTLTLTYTAEGTFTGSNSLVLAKESIPIYTVTFDSNGGSSVDAQTVIAGATATEPTAPTKEGFEFAGWTLNGEAYDFSAEVNADITLVAVWNEPAPIVEYTVIFMKGTTVVDTQKVVAGQCATQPANPTAPSNYTFAYWELDGAEFDFSTPITADTTLVAKYKGKDVTLVFYYDRNDCGTSSTKFIEVTVEYGTVLDPSKIPVSSIVMKDGEVFTGNWHKGSSHSSASLDLTKPIDFTTKQKLYPGFVHTSVTALEGVWTGTSSSTDYTFTIEVDDNYKVTATVVIVEGENERTYTVYDAQFDGTNFSYKGYKTTTATTLSTMTIKYSETEVKLSSPSAVLTKQ